MRKSSTTLLLMIACLLVPAAYVLSHAETKANEWATVVQAYHEAEAGETNSANYEPVSDSGFDVEVLVDGRTLDEYPARGRTYVEALENAEYELRISNPYGERVAVALSVDGLNTIDARRTSAWNASKWVIEPYGSITISGWQMSSSRARHFYFTTERDSYGAKLGQTANLGVISAVFFRERHRVTVLTPPRPPVKEDERRSEERGREPSASTNSSADSAGSSSSARRGSTQPYPAPDDKSAATGIGRNVRNDVTWVNMDLDRQPSAEVTIRYEFYDSLVRLGIYPRRYQQPDTLRRRERSTGFDDRRYSPEP